MSADRAAGRRELVLVGGGHTHVQVLRSFAMEPPPRTRLTVILDTPVAVYSGMVPGFVAGQYRAEELEIDVVPLARRARARVVLSAAVGIDAERGRIEVEGRPPIPYDLASCDIGSTVAALDLPGIRRHALPTRPIGRFVQRVRELDELAADRRTSPLRVVVVGGGAGGVELAFALRHRLMKRGAAVDTLIAERGPRLLSGYPEGLARRVEKRAVADGIEIRTGVEVAAAEPGEVLLTGGERLACDALIWVTGAVSHSLLGDSGLPTDDRGFVRTRSTLQVEGHDDLFAVGDCATLTEHPRTPKAGVYAVRQGPYLIENLAAHLAGTGLRSYHPQGDFLTLLNLADGSALGSKWGLSFGGSWVMTLKDRIDRRFMRRFQVLDPAGRETAEFRAQAGMEEGEEMLCGGCAAKVGQSLLDRALRRLGPPPPDESVVLGLATPDDAAAYRLGGGGVVVSSVDSFRAFTDDPYLVGRVAAVNAASDLHATGVDPRWALALVTVPDDEDDAAAEETLFQTLSGARAAFDELGVTLVGGHTTTGRDLTVGFSVEGEAAPGESLLRLDALAPGEALILTQALGTGVLFHADMRGRARGPWVESAIAAMLRGNHAAARLAREMGASAVTDVTGFGLAGHLGEMLRAGGVAAEVELDRLPALPGALELLAAGERSTAHAQNERAGSAISGAARLAGEARLELLFDPQTSGGLLVGVAQSMAADLVSRLRETGYPRSEVIGRVTPPRPDGALFEVVAGAASRPRR